MSHVRILAALYALFAVVPIVVQGDAFWLSMFSKLFINIILALSMWPLFMIGRLNLGQVAFYGLGSYGVAVLMINLHMSFWLALPITILVLAVVAAIVAYPSLRITGMHFAMATLALAEIVRQIYLRFDWPFGGHVGLFNIPSASPIAIPGLPVISFKGFVEQYYLILVALLVCTGIFYRYAHSDVGLTARAVRGSAGLARATGVNTFRQDVACFVMSAMGAAVAGALYAGYAHYLEPDTFGVLKSIDILAYVAVGGGTTVLGPVVGTMMLTLLPQLLQIAPKAAPIITGALLIITMLFFPSGLVNLRAHARQWRWVQRIRRNAPPVPEKAREAALAVSDREG